MPSVTVAQRHEANLDPINNAHIILLEFQEDHRSTVNYVAINNEDITHNSQTYIGTKISFTLPNSGDDEPTVRMEMSNLSRVIGRVLNEAKNQIGCRIKLIDSSDPDVTLIDTYNMFIITGAKGNSINISAELGLRATLAEPVPFRRTSKRFFPGVWWTK